MISLFSLIPFKKLPARYGAMLMPLVLSCLMTFVVSGIASLRAVGPSPAFLTVWMQSWPLSWLVAYPVLILLLPVVRRVVAVMTE